MLIFLIVIGVFLAGCYFVGCLTDRPLDYRPR